LEIIGDERLLEDSIIKRRWKMVEHTLRHPEELHSTILEGMIEGKRPFGRLRNTFIGQIKKDAGVGSYRALKEMAGNRVSGEEWLQTNLRVEKKCITQFVISSYTICHYI